MSWKKVASDYLTFTRKERVGMLVLVIVIFIFLLLPALINNQSKSKFSIADTSWISAVKKLETKETTGKDRKLFSSRSDDNEYSAKSNQPVPTPISTDLFYFDPNTLDQEGWKKLGLTDKSVHIIQNYLSKGGHFYKTEDLEKIYGLSQTIYKRLAPFVKIGDNSREDSYIRKENEPKHNSYNTVDINLADSVAFIALPGIGSKLAERIILFRDKLGGFYSVDQIHEIYGLRDSVFQNIRQYLEVKEITLKKINVNLASKDELKTHPYIKWNLANTIVEYRNQHGNFSSLTDLKRISSITDSIYLRIVSYLTL